MIVQGLKSEGYLRPLAGQGLTLTETKTPSRLKTEVAWL